MSSLALVSEGRAGSAGQDLPHVLLVVDGFPKSLGGGERVALRLAELLPAWGYRTSMLTFSIDPESRVPAESPCPLYLLPLTRTYDITAMRGAVELRRFLRKQEVKIVQTFFESSDLWAGLVTKALSSAKLIWSRRDMGILRARKHTVLYGLMRRAPDAVFAVSEGVRRHCLEVDRVPAERVRTVYNGIDLEGWGEGPLVGGEVAGEVSGEASGAIRVVTVGNIRRVKGHDVLLRAAATVHEELPGVQFEVAGGVLEPEFLAELEEEIRSAGMEETFRFAGGLTDLRSYLAGADVFALPSRSEGFSNAILEAMAASLPVVATDVGGNAEAVEDGVTGFVVPPEDPEALAGAVLRLARDASLRRQMGAAGREAALRKFTTEAMLRQITGVYGALLTK